MTSINGEAPPIPKRICLKTTDPTPDSLDPENAFKDKPLIMDAALDQLTSEKNDDTDAFPGSMSMNSSNNNDPNTSTSNISKNLFSDTPLENGSDITHDMEYLMSSTEETKDILPKTNFPKVTTPNGNSDVLFDSIGDAPTDTFTISRHSCETLGIVLGMNEIIDAYDGEIRRVYVKKIAAGGAMIKAMNKSNCLRLGDEILAINGTYIKNLSRTECLNILIDLPVEMNFLLLRNTLPWTTGPRCSFYLNLVDKNPESILSPAPKLFTNEGKKIPDGYKLLEISLYKEASDLLGISIVPSYGGTRHYYQIKELEPDGICSKSKLLSKGDCLVSCNGNSLHRIPFNQCLNILKSEGPSLTFEVFRKDDNPTTLESLETQTTYNNGSEVNNNTTNNNDNDNRSTNTFTSELLIPAERKLTESTNPFLSTSSQDLTSFRNSDSKSSPEISDSEVPPDISHFKSPPDISHFEDSPDISESKASIDIIESDLLPDISHFESPPDAGDFEALPGISHPQTSIDIRDQKTSLDTSDSETTPDISDLKVSLDISDLNTSSEISDSKTFIDVSDIDTSVEISDLNTSAEVSDLNTTAEVSDLNTTVEVSDLNTIAEVGDSKTIFDISDSEVSSDIIDFKAPPDISDPEASPDISHFKAPPDISGSFQTSEHNSSSLDGDLKSTFSKPLLDFLTGSPFIESKDNYPPEGLQKPIEACQAEPSPPPTVEEPCFQLTTEAVESSPRADWSSQLNMSEQLPANNAFSLDGLEEFSNLNNANELNNNFNTGYASSSNEDLISIDTDVLSPTITNPTLIFYNHADPWEAAGEAKSENLLSDYQMSQSTNPKNVLNEFIDTVESPDYGSDPLDGLQENIMQVDHEKKCLSSPPTNFGADIPKGLTLETPSGNGNLDEEERTSPISYDDSLSGSIGIHTADEDGDIPLSARNSDNDLIEEIPESPDSGRADSPGVDKNNSYDQEKYNKKGIILTLQPTRICDENDKLTDEDTVYHTISDVSRKNKGSENHGSFDSCESYATSVGSFESCAETGEQDNLGTNPKHSGSKNVDATLSQTKSLPRNAFSHFKEYQSGTTKPSNEKYSTLKSDTKLFSFNEITASGPKNDPGYGKSDYIKKLSNDLFSRNYSTERKSDQIRCEDKPFQVEVLKGIIGLGMTLKADDQGGFVKVTHIQNNSPIGRNGTIKVGDYILAINNTNIVGESDSRVQQILRLLPRGLIKVVASAVPISDWKQFAEDAEKSSVGNSGRSTVSLTSPIKMPDSFSLRPRATYQKRSSISFSSALNVFNKDQTADSAKQSPPTVPSIPISPHKNQCDKTETRVKTFGFLSNTKQSPPLDKKLTKLNSSFEQSPQSSPEVVLSQVRMFENFYQKNNSNQEIREPVLSPKQKTIESCEPRIQKQFQEKDSKEALPDILQDHTNPFKKQFSHELKSGTAKAIAKSYDAKSPGSDGTDFSEDIIVPVKTPKYKTFSALPRCAAPRILDSFSMWDSMDSITMEKQNKVPHVNQTVNQVCSSPKDAVKDVVKEEVIIPKKKSSVQSLVNRFNSPQGGPSRSSSPQNIQGPTVSKGFKSTSEESIYQSLRAVMEETIEPIRKARLTNMSKPLPINFSETFDIDEVLIIEKTERKDSKPDLKMTLTGPYSPAMEVSEPVLKPEKKAEVKSVRRPVASPRKYVLKTPRTPTKDASISEVKVSEPEVSFGIARRLPQSAVPDCIDIINIPEMVSPDSDYNILEEKIKPQLKSNRFQPYIESPRTKRAKAISLLSSMDDDNSPSASSHKQESKGFVSDCTEVNEDEIIPYFKGLVSMSAKPRKIDNIENATMKSLDSNTGSYCQWRETSDSSSWDDLDSQSISEDFVSCSSDVADNKAKEIVKSVIRAAEKELCRKGMSSVKKPRMTICDITGHNPWDEDNLPVTSEDNLPVTYEDNVRQILEPELCAEIKPQKLSAQKRNLPLIENGRPKPMPRQSRQVSPSREPSADVFGERQKSSNRSLPSPRPKYEIQPSTQETNIDSPVSARLISPIPFQRSVSPSGRLRNSSESDTVNYFSAPTSPQREQKPSFFKQTSTSCLESLLNSELHGSSSGRSLPTTPKHNRCLPSTPADQYKFAGRSLPPVPDQSSPWSSGQQIEFKTKTWMCQPLVSQVTSTKFVSQSVQLQDAPLNVSSNMKWTNHPELPSTESPVHPQESHQIKENAKVSESSVIAKKTVSLFANKSDKIEKPSSPVSYRKSPTSWLEYKQTEHKAPIITKSANLFSVDSPPKEESDLLSSPPRISALSSDCQDNDTPNSSMDDLNAKETAQNRVPSPVINLSEVKSEITLPTPPPRPVTPTKDVTDGICISKVIPDEKPISVETKPLEFETETFSMSSPIKILSSAPVLPKVGERSPLLASPVSPSRNVIENQASLPSPSRPTFHLKTNRNDSAPVSPSRSTLHLETNRHDSAPASPSHLSPRRMNTNRKLPDIFQGSHTLKSVSSPTKVNRFSETPTQSESIPKEVKVLEHKIQKVEEISKPEVALSQSISVEPKTASVLADTKLETHSVEIRENLPKAEVAVSQSINVEPTTASVLSEVKVEKPNIQVIEEVSKPEIAVSEFIGVKPTTTTDLPEKLETQSAAVVEEIAKPEVAVSQFIGINPKTTSDLSSRVKELKENRVLLRSDSAPVPHIRSVKSKEQDAEVLAGVQAPKSEVAVSKYIGSQPTTATKLSGPVKSSGSTDVQKDTAKQSPLSKSRHISTSRPDIVASAELGRPSFLRHKSSDVIGSRRLDRIRPKTEIFSKELSSIFSKRKWCISTKSGQTNFAFPSEPETINRVVQLGLIDEDQLDSLLTSANLALDKMGFSNNEEIHIAILEKDATEKIGIRLKKGEQQELVISLLEPDGAAIKQKFIYIGDSLLLVNGKAAWNQTVMDVKVWLQTIETRIILVLCRHPMDEEEAANDCEYIDIILRKGVTGVGFCLEGGVGCPLGDRPISVKRIFKGGPAEKGGQLMIGDEIIKVNGVDFTKQRHFVAWNHLKFLPEGDVELHICRRKSHTKASQIQETDTVSEVANESA